MDWIDKFESKGYKNGMAILIAMHRKIGSEISSTTKSSKRIEIIILILSVLTSGALWIIVGNQFVTLIQWVGAAISTILTGLTIYQLTEGPKKQLERLNELYSEFGRSLAHARTYPNNFSWHNFKHLEASYIKTGLDDPTRDEISDAQITGMID